ncbi:MAG: hypothetical protein C4B57_01765 [Deltaproteobacteria bacterium]|nr:MAG: hypothetical protein C4B57_01765 [Deltaproteobacteria bacterium]
MYNHIIKGPEYDFAQNASGACPRRQTGIQHTQAGKESKAMQYGVFSPAIACMIIFHVGDSHG